MTEIVFTTKYLKLSLKFRQMKYIYIYIYIVEKNKLICYCWNITTRIQKSFGYSEPNMSYDNLSLLHFFLNSNNKGKIISFYYTSTTLFNFLKN